MLEVPSHRASLVHQPCVTILTRLTSHINPPAWPWAYASPLMSSQPYASIILAATLYGVSDIKRWVTLCLECSVYVYLAMPRTCEGPLDFNANSLQPYTTCPPQEVTHHVVKSRTLLSPILTVADPGYNF